MYSFVGRRSTTAETTAAAAHLGVTTYMFFLIFVLGTFLRVLYNNMHHHVAFVRELEEKKKKHRAGPTSSTSAAAAAAAEAPAAEASSTATTSGSGSSSSSRKAGVRPDSNTRRCEGQASLFRATEKPIHAKTELKLVPGTYIPSILNTAQPCL